MWANLALLMFTTLIVYSRAPPTAENVAVAVAVLALAGTSSAPVSAAVNRVVSTVSLLQLPTASTAARGNASNKERLRSMTPPSGYGGLHAGSLRHTADVRFVKER